MAPSRSSLSGLTGWCLLIPALVVALGGPLCPVVSAEEVSSRDEIKLWQLNLQPKPSVIASIATFEEQLFILDSGIHELLIYQNDQLVRSVGGIGNRPGELFYPDDIYVVDRDHLLVFDGGNHRIQSFDLQGRHIKQFSGLPKPWGLAGSSETFFLGQPARGQLVSVFRHDEGFSKTFGELLSPIELWGRERGADDGARPALNRIHMTIDSDSHLWVVFQHSPILRKYSQEGELLLEAPIEAPGIERLQEAVSKRVKAPGATAINIDGVQLTVVVHDIEFDPSTGLIMVLLGDQRLMGLDRQANLLYLEKLPAWVGHFEHLAASPKGGMIVGSSSSVYVARSLTSTH